MWAICASGGCIPAPLFCFVLCFFPFFSRHPEVPCLFVQFDGPARALSRTSKYQIPNTTILRLCPNILLNLCVSYGRLWSAFPGIILGALPRHNFTALSTHYHGALPMPDYSLLSQEAIPISVLFSCTSSGLCRITTPGLWPNRCCKILDSELHKRILKVPLFALPVLYTQKILTSHQLQRRKYKQRQLNGFDFWFRWLF